MPISHAVLAKRWEAHWESASVERFITITDEGLKLGTTLLAKFGIDGQLALDEKHIRCLLAVAYDSHIPQGIVRKIKAAERARKQHGIAMMHMHFALAPFYSLETREQVRNLFYADEMLKSGIPTERVLKSFGLERFNPYHVPAGSPEGGQFTTAEGAGGSAGITPRSTVPKGGTQVAVNAAELIPLAVPVVGTAILAIGAAGRDKAKPVPLNMEGEEDRPVTSPEAQDSSNSGNNNQPKEPKNDNSEWKLGVHKPQKEWDKLMKKREWTKDEITNTIQNGESLPTYNRVNNANKALRYIDPKTGKSVVRDEVTKEILHIGEKGYDY